MSNESNNPLNPADPPETQPPGGSAPESDGESARAADVPETQPPGS
ncbi:MAG TPA: hypothetical protein VN644_11680 [Pyrinomonadaceae bacterium]|nr:hypothetical protein [Pyrinomonadaceae bacterium]